MPIQIKRYLYTVFLTAVGYGAYSAVNILFFLEKGLDFKTISLLFIWLNLFILLCEIPTGIVADKIKPINAVMLGCVIIVLSRLFLLVDITYNLEASMIIYGIGISFISGAANAVLMGLKQTIQSSEKLFSWSLTYRSIGAILGGIGAYYLFNVNINYPWIYSATAYGLSAIILFSYRADYQFSITRKIQLYSFPALLKEIIHKPFFWASVFYNSSALAPFLLWQYLFKQFPYGVELGYLCLQIGMLCSSKLARVIKFTEGLRIFIIVLNLVVMLFIPIFSNLFYVLFILLVFHVFLVGWQSIFFNANFHDNIQNSSRATSESIMSAMDSTISIPLIYLIGYFMDQKFTILAFGISIMSGAFALFFFIQSRRK